MTERARELQISRQQLGKLFKAFWADLPVSPAQAAAAEVLILDGVYLSGRNNAVLIARDLSNVHAWHFADRECFAAWQKRYAGFLAERRRSAETARWWYIHRKLRAA